MTATQSPPGTRSLLGPALAAGAAATVLLLACLYLDTPWKGDGNKEWALTTERYGLVGLLVSLGFVAAGLGIVFGIVVTRGLRRPAEAETRRSLAVALTGVVSAVAFWTGLPVILAAGAVVLAIDTRDRLGRTTATAFIALAVAALTTVAAVYLALTG